MIPEWDDVPYRPDPDGLARLAAAVEESRRTSRWQRLTGWLTGLRWSPVPWGMSGYRGRAAGLLGDELDGATRPRDTEALLCAALWRRTHGYDDPGPGSVGCMRLVDADEAVFALQVCGLPPEHAVHQTPAVVLGGGEQR